MNIYLRNKIKLFLAGRGRKPLANAALLCASLLFSYALCELILWRYEAALLASVGIYVPIDPTVDGAAWDVDPAGFERFRWQDDGNSIVHVKSDNPVLAYGLRPGAKISDTIQINSQGFRDYEFSQDKSAEVYRIIVLGDSITFGWTQRQSEIYPKMLESMLNDAAPPSRKFEVYNMGVGGYHAGQELELLKTQALQFKPDMLIVGYCSNDNQIGYDAGLWRHFTRSASRTWDFAKLRWLLFQENIARKSLVERSYEAMENIAQQHNIPILVLIFPDKGDKDGQLSMQQAELCTRLGMESVNLYAPFKERGMDNLLVDMIHPNSTGHAVAAQALFKHLKPQLLAESSTTTP